MSAKLLFFILIAVAIYLHFKGKQRARDLRQPQARQRMPEEKPVERMVACRLCGLLLPESEALITGNHHYCCEEHRRQDRR